MGASVDEVLTHAPGSRGAARVCVWVSERKRKGEREKKRERERERERKREREREYEFLKTKE